MNPRQSAMIGLLENVSSRREIDQYLSLFRDADPRRFAVIKVGGALLESDREALASAIACLFGMGLLPIIVHGGGPQLSKALAEAGVESTFVDGSRVTCEKTLVIARAVFQRECIGLAKALGDLGVPAQPVVSGVFEAERESDARLGFVGRVVGIDHTLIDAAIDAGQVPILSSLGHSASGQILNINADVATRELAIAMQPRKVVFLTGTGGLLDERGRIIPAVNIIEDLDRLLAESWVDGGMELKLREIDQLLAKMPRHSSVSITSPEHLVRELFTHKGFGTMVQQGVGIQRFDSYSEVDTSMLRSLLESSFGRPLDPDYFLCDDVKSIYIADDESAAAIVTKGLHTSYLDKFAVTLEAQGAGIGASLWNRVVAQHPSLVWRSQRGNPINPWYFERADGALRGPESMWAVFWIGLEDLSLIESCVADARSRKASFLDGAPHACLH